MFEKWAILFLHPPNKGSGAPWLSLPLSVSVLELFEHGVEAVVDLRDLELLQLDGGRVEGEPDGERELGVHQEGRLEAKI